MDGVLFLYTDLLKKVFLFIRMLGTKIGSGHVPKVFKLLQSCHLAPGLAAGSIVRAARNVRNGPHYWLRRASPVTIPNHPCLGPRAVIRSARKLGQMSWYQATFDVSRCSRIGERSYCCLDGSTPARAAISKRDVISGRSWPLCR